MNTDKQDKDNFENIAKELGCDESDDALDRAFERVEFEKPVEEAEKDSEEE